MDHVVLSLSDHQPPSAALRCRSHAAFVSRLAFAEGRRSVVRHGNDDATGALTELAASAAVTGGGEPPAAGEIRYVPTGAARERVGTAQDGAWPQSVASRQSKALRRTSGVLFSFPPEDPATTEVALEVFTTDWSPSPAACAVAVHPGHPLSSGLAAGRGAAFTGRYCRHPLTGDLLPIWTAAWVKPEFGTGAVLVNPGHDAADLAFGREVGLPVRFALAPSGHEDGPGNWLTPPLVKTGHAVRTGRTDGLDHAAAQSEYFRILSERGLARMHTDVGAGSFPVAAFDADGPDKVHWNQERNTIGTPGRDDSTPVRVTPAGVLAALDPAVRRSELVVVAPSSAIESDLLALRLLLAEPDLGPAPERAPDVLLTGTVTGQTDGVEADVLEVTVLTAAAAQETLSVKPQQLDTARRFLAAHAALVGTAGAPEGDADPALVKAAAQVRTLLVRRDVKQAFTHLYRLQKTLTKGDAPTSGSLAVYEALAWVALGLSGTHSGDRANAVWQGI
ncbi:hypothetical protein ACSMX9_19355 [Streptomyces sp. LE64]|uniref:hypothetical protein n=1 Tax=Streptomyces sp. LE64 TaxID=3448653 RepID=UPI0040411726